jgi:hypothetical protein
VGGPRVTDETVNFIRQAWLSLKSEENPKPSAKQVLGLAEALIQKHKIKDIELPKIRKTQQILLDLGKNHRKLPNKEKVMQGPWSMATLLQHPLPAQSLRSVLYVWRYALISGETFTIRQAKWVSRLWGFGSDPQDPDAALLLWLSAYDYAKKEEATLVSKRPFDTLEDDLQSMFTPFQVATLWKAKYGDKPVSHAFSTSIPYCDDGSVMHEVIHPLEYYNALYNGTISNDRDKDLHGLLAKMPSLFSRGPVSLEVWIAYMIWVTNVKQRPEWPLISAIQASTVIEKLRQWSVEVVSIKYDPDRAKPLVAASTTDDTHWCVDPDLPTPKEALRLLEEYAKEETK